MAHSWVCEQPAARVSCPETDAGCDPHGHRTPAETVAARQQASYPCCQSSTPCHPWPCRPATRCVASRPNWPQCRRQRFATNSAAPADAAAVAAADGGGRRRCPVASQSVAGSDDAGRRDGTADGCQVGRIDLASRLANRAATQTIRCYCSRRAGRPSYRPVARYGPCHHLSPGQSPLHLQRVNCGQISICCSRRSSWLSK